MFPSQDDCDIEHGIVRSRLLEIAWEIQSWLGIKPLMTLIYRPEVIVMKLN